MQQCPDQGCWHPPCVPQLQEAAPRLLADFLTDGQRPVDLLELFFFFFPTVITSFPSAGFAQAALL